MANPKLTLLAGTNPVEGGANGIFTINLDSPAPVGGLSVNYDAIGSTATLGTDYTLMAGANVSNVSTNAFTITAGATTATLNLAALADTVIDPNETVSVNLTAGAGYALASSAVTFEAKLDYVTGSYPRSVSIGDFNNDGNTDLAVGEQNNNTVSVLLRNATNTGFDAIVHYSTGSTSTSVSAGDFNNDGKFDLAVANWGSDTVSVLLRNAINTGFDPNVVTKSRGPSSVSVGDFNNDGKTDLAVANEYSDTVSVLLRNTTNTGFMTKVDVATGSFPVSVGVDDFNNDGKADLAVVNQVSKTISVFLRNSTNTGFDTKVDYATGISPVSVSSGDFNNDGTADLAVTNQGNDTVSVFLRNSTNTGFDAKVDYATGISPVSVSSGDLNNDGTADLAVVNRGSGTISVFLRNSTNTGFDAKVDVTTGSYPYSVGVGDFNNDGKSDLAVANYDDNTVSVLLNTSPPSTYATLTLADVAPLLNHPPVLSGTPATLNGTENSTYIINAGDLLQGFSDVDGDILSIANLVADKGILADNNDGTWTLTPNANYSGVIALSYTISDNKGGTVAANNTITLAAATAGVSIIGSDLITSEQGDTAVFSVKLNAAPTRDVTLDFTSSDTSEGIITNPSLKFTSANWATAQTFTVTGQNDSSVDGDIAYNITAKLTTLDIFYKSVNTHNLILTNQDTPVSKVEYIDGTNGMDVLQGTSAPSYMLGEAADDDLSGGAGNDTIYGSYGNDLLFGEDGNDELYGEQDADYLDGGAGNDILNGGLGKDTLIGGAGNDTYYLSEDQPTSPDTIDDQGLATDVDTVIVPYNWNKYTLPTGIENGTITEGTGASSLTGNGSDNTLTGNDGNNTLIGAVGRDSLFGGAGDDRLEGGSDDDQVDAGDGNDEIIAGNGMGDDTYSGGAGIDTIKYTSATTGITVDLEQGTASGAEIDNDQLNGIENIIGGQAGDTLTGDGGNNLIDGFTGNDTLIGGAGQDTLMGGLGNDTYLVDDKADMVIESSKLAAEIDAVNSSISYALGANLENLTLTGTAAINGSGNARNNILTGNAGANNLTGGIGVDRLAGGLGADRFKFNAVTDTGIAANKRDSIVDFNHSQGDKIDLSAIDADTTLAGNNIFSAPTVGGAFNGVFANKGELYFDQAAHVLYGNNDTDSAADFSIRLMGVGGLVALDLVL